MSRDAYIHKVLPGSPGAPILFTFHGTGGDENQLIGLGRDLVPGATIVSPRGDVSEMGAARFFKRTGEGIYDMADLARATAKMADFIRAHIDVAEAARASGIGYSNGANILASVFFTQPALLAGAALMHPLIPFKPDIADGLAGKRILITAGRRDPICPPDLTSRLAEHLQQAGADTISEWHDGGHEVRPNEIEAAKRFFQAEKAENA